MSHEGAAVEKPSASVEGTDLGVRENVEVIKTCSARTTARDNSSDKTKQQVHVLVADDDDALRNLLANLLQRDGCFVSTAATGKEAVEIISKRTMDVALIDVKMPDLDGMEVLRKSKEIHPEMEVVIITGFYGPEMAEQAMQFGAYDFIRKPFTDIKQIPRCVRRAAEKRRISEENARLMAQLFSQKCFLREKLTELGLLYRLSMAAERVTNHEKLSENLLETFLSVAGVEACSSFFPRKTPPLLIVKSKRKMSEKGLACLKELAVREAKEAANRDIVAEHVSLRFDYLGAASDSSAHKTADDIKAHRSLPVVVESEAVCILSVLGFKDEKFRESDVRLFSVLASQASRMVERVGFVVRAERSKIAAIIDGMPEGLIVFGMDGDIEFLNARAKETLGLTGDGAVPPAKICRRLEALGLGALFAPSDGGRERKRAFIRTESEKVFCAELSEVKFFDTEPVGKLLVLREVTDENQAAKEVVQRASER